MNFSQWLKGSFLKITHLVNLANLSQETDILVQDSLPEHKLAYCIITNLEMCDKICHRALESFFFAEDVLKAGRLATGKD